jgi:hypothetical protein
VEITPMGLKTRPEEDEGDKSLELESPLWEKLFMRRENHHPFVIPY